MASGFAFDSVFPVTPVLKALLRSRRFAWNYSKRNVLRDA